MTLQNYSRTILFICPGENWSTRERAALRDIIIAKENGYNVLVYVEEDSLFHQKMKLYGIEVLCIEPHFLNRLTVFHNHLPIKKIVDERKVDIVHCYDFSYLFSISFQLQRRVMVSFVLSQDHAVDKQLRSFWYRPIITRIDSLLLLNKHLKNDSLGGLQLPVKKIEYFGLPILTETEPSEEEKKALIDVQKQFEQYDENFLVGAYVSPTSYDLKILLPLFSALEVLKQKNPAGKSSKLVLISHVNFKEIPLFESMAKYIQDHKLENDLIFVTTRNIEIVQKYVQTWICVDQNDLIEDYAISAILADVPVIFVRNFSSNELVREFQGIGETYKAEDARELREKWEKMLTSNTVYAEKTRVFKYFFEREFSLVNYRTNLLGLYARIVQRRNRLFKK